MKKIAFTLLALSMSFGTVSLAEASRPPVCQNSAHFLMQGLDVKFVGYIQQEASVASYGFKDKTENYQVINSATNEVVGCIDLFVKTTNIDKDPCQLHTTGHCQ